MRTDLHVSDGQMVVSNTQDCTPIAERATAMRNQGIHGSSEMRLAATIPNVMIEKYCNDNGISYAEWSSNREHIRRMLQDPALAHFRVWPGRV